MALKITFHFINGHVTYFLNPVAARENSVLALRLSSERLFLRCQFVTKVSCPWGDYFCPIFSVMSGAMDKPTRVY